MAYLDLVILIPDRSVEKHERPLLDTEGLAVQVRDCNHFPCFNKLDQVTGGNPLLIEQALLLELAKDPFEEQLPKMYSLYSDASIWIRRMSAPRNWNRLSAADHSDLDRRRSGKQNRRSLSGLL
jgi:hypothetical protein